MSAHETERLSAWLDGELAAADRAAVEAHLAGCAECARHLEAMAAVDERLRESAVEAPAGYFDALPGRIRERIDETRRGRPRRVPSWTWAAAAALLLAVVTPLTLRTRATTPPASTPPAARSETAGAAEALREREHRPAAAPQPVEPAAPPAAAGAPRENKGAPPARIAADSPSRDATSAPDRSPAQTAPARAELRREIPAGERDEGAGAAASFEAPAPAVAVASAPAEPAPLAEGRARAVLAKRSAEDWRRERDRWRSVAEASPQAAGADAARLRVVEASFEILSLTGQEADREAFEREARAYLDREDADGKDRVLGLLRRAEALPR